ncbi:MAG: alpha/beta hydrolase [[Clostridium] cellulosi]|nr:MAG: acetylesterase [[Clostridium] cellulosi]
MLHKVFKLRELFPELAKESLESLSEARRKHIESVGKANECWAAYREPTLTAYCPDVSPEIDKNSKRISILICPGGSYEFCSFREAEPIALAFNALGYNAFVLNYSVAPVRYPQALLEVSASMALIRNKAEIFHADPQKIAVCGFSAGGHLAASLGVFWNEEFISDTLGIEKCSNKPNAMILGYPVITSGEYTHQGSMNCLLGKNAPKELVEKMSLELQVSENTPPAFIWHTFEDDCVPCENALLFANALRKKNIPFELHIFQNGGHGLSLCNKVTSKFDEQNIPHVSNWFQLCHEWLEVLFNS